MTMGNADRAVISAVEAVAGELHGLSAAVHEAAELGFEEHRSVDAIERVLRDHGLAIDRGFGGLETAFRASAGSGKGPRLAVFAEYDALPGIGHGCGHNLICGAGVGAFLGLAAIAEQLDGTVELIGSPAEENGSAKEILAATGALDGIDAAMMVHPSSQPGQAGVTTIGLRSVEIAYHGVAAHAAANPHLGRNALDAIVFAYQGVAALRQHMLPSSRLHGIISEGGEAANVVPELTRGRFVIRAESLDELVGLSGRVQQILEGAALMTGTRLEATWDRVPPNLPVRSNRELARRFAGYFRGQGQEIADEGLMSGSTDMGNVSLRLPAIHPSFNVTSPDVGMHTREFAACANTQEANTAMVDAAIAMALTARDYLEDAEVRRAVREEFEAAGGAVDVASLLRPPTAN